MDRYEQRSNDELREDIASLRRTAQHMRATRQSLDGAISLELIAIEKEAILRLRDPASA